MTGPPLTGPREDLLPRWDIFEEHLSEAAFLWSRRDRCLLSPRFDLAETGLEEARLVAHLDALAEAGDAVTRKLLVPALEEEDPEHLSTAAYVLLAQRGAEASSLLQEALGAGDTARHAAIQRALELWEGPGWVERLSPLFTAPLAQFDVRGVARREAFGGEDHQRAPVLHGFNARGRGQRRYYTAAPRQVRHPAYKRAGGALRGEQVTVLA